VNDHPDARRFFVATHPISEGEIYSVKAVVDFDFDRCFSTVVPTARIAAKLVEFLLRRDAAGDSFAEIEAAADNYAEALIDDWRDMRAGPMGLVSFCWRRLLPRGGES
jgi:uncharacterized heparinase superfamily protein